MATVKGASIHVEGLSEFRRELRRLDDRTLTSELKDANFAVAQRVVGWAHYRAAGQGRMAVKAAATLRASKSQARAAVSFGGAKAPFAAGSEFGAIRNIPRRSRRGEVRGWNQFKEWRGNGRDAGYWLFPAIRANETQIVEEYGDAIEKITAKAFPD
jgi:hypothetical protein